MEPPATTLANRLIYAARIALAGLVGVAGVILLLATFEPLVASFPRASGARELIFAVALLWGVVIGGFTAVVSLGSWRTGQGSQATHLSAEPQRTADSDRTKPAPAL